MEIKRPGFTIIEAMIYVSIASILLLSILSFFYDSIFHEKRLGIAGETLNDAGILMQRINSEVRNSVGVDSSGSHDICLINNKSVYSYGSTKISFSNGSVILSRSSNSNCSPLQSSAAIDSNLSLISNLEFDHISNNSGDIVKYTVSFAPSASIAKSGLPGDASNFVYSSSVTIRSW